MSFTDPFNRVNQKKDREYKVFHEKLKQAGLETEEEVKAAFQRSRRRMFGFGSMVILVALLVSLIWQEMAGIAIIFGSLILVWLAATMLRGQQMIRQYIRQEFAGKR